MEPILQALIMGVVQGLTEFLPISSSGHLIILPALLGWTDPFIESLAFSVMLHVATLVALLVYFRADWSRLVPAGFAAVRDRSLGGDPDRRLAWILAMTTVPAILAGLLLNEPVSTLFRDPAVVAAALVAGALVLWFADRRPGTGRAIAEIDFRAGLAIGVAQAFALVPGISRSGISIAAGRLLGLSREAAARFSFLMATPVIALAGAYETRGLLSGASGVEVAPGPLVVGMLAGLVSGLVAIAVLLRFLRSNSLAVFVAYRLLLAALVAAWWLGGGR